MSKQLPIATMLATSEKIKEVFFDYFPNLNNAQLLVEINGNWVQEEELINKFDSSFNLSYDHAEFYVEENNIIIDDDGTVDTLFRFSQEQIQALNKMMNIFKQTFQ